MVRAVRFLEEEEKKHRKTYRRPTWDPFGPMVLENYPEQFFFLL